MLDRDTLEFVRTGLERYPDARETLRFIIGLTGSQKLCRHAESAESQALRPFHGLLASMDSEQLLLYGSAKRVSPNVPCRRLPALAKREPERARGIDPGERHNSPFQVRILLATLVPVVELCWQEEYEIPFRLSPWKCF